MRGDCVSCGDEPRLGKLNWVMPKARAGGELAWPNNAPVLMSEVSSGVERCSAVMDSCEESSTATSCLEVRGQEFPSTNSLS